MDFHVSQYMFILLLKILFTVFILNIFLRCLAIGTPLITTTAQERLKYLYKQVSRRNCN